MKNIHRCAEGARLATLTPRPVVPRAPAAAREARRRELKPLRTPEPRRAAPPAEHTAALLPGDATTPTVAAEVVAVGVAGTALALVVPPGSEATAFPAAVAPAPVPTLKSWPTEERPRERLMSVGAAALSTAELIAILLRSGTTEATAWDVARELLRGADGRLRTLSTRDYRELARVRGVGPVKAITLVAALELGRRRAAEADVEHPEVRTSAAAYRQLAPVLADLTHEECWVLLLNNASRCTACKCVSSGGLVGTVVDVRNLMAIALRHDATAIVLAHNHPSGTLAPSAADLAITRQIAAAGTLLNIPLNDHLIVAGRRYFSFRDEKLLPA